MLATAAAIHCTVFDSRTVANASATPAPHHAARANIDREISGDDMDSTWPIATATAVTAVDR
jgi:hypothetical protein